MALRGSRGEPSLPKPGRGTEMFGLMYETQADWVLNAELPNQLSDLLDSDFVEQHVRLAHW